MTTSFYAGLLGFLFLKISIDTIRARKKHLVSLGGGPNNEITSLMSAHSNFASYVPFFLLLLFFSESKSPPWLIHSVGICFVLGRLLHYDAFRTSKMKFRRRVQGMHLTLWPMVFLSALQIFFFILEFTQNPERM